MNGTSQDFQRLLDEAVRFHGHLCGGQIIGVRMAMAGLRELDIKDPRGRQGKDLVIFVEVDRCASDAIISVTGRTPGKRSIKIRDYGKMAATFIDTRSDRAVRVNVRPDSDEKTRRIAQTDLPQKEEKEAYLAALAAMPEEDLLRIQAVSVELKPQDLPGKPLDTAACQKCGETVLDMRQVVLDGKVLCKPCARGSDYYAVEGGSLPALGLEGFVESKRKLAEPAPMDWNELWRKAHRGKVAPTGDSKFWDRRAHAFTRHATASDYVGQFLEIVKPEPRWSVLDIGCAAGTVAVPLAASVETITALDSSSVMLSLLDERRREEGIENIRIVRGRWEDDWDALGIGVHDVAIASRSLIVEDLRAAILKLQGHARRRVYISALVDDGPYDRNIVEAAGRKFHLGADYIVVYNLLRQMGIYANVAFTVNREEKTYGDVEDALDSMRWMIHEMTPEEEDRLRNHLAGCLVRDNDRWKLPYGRVVRWAVLWWEKD